jgi:para-aminobenzoate synthetase component I
MDFLDKEQAKVKINEFGREKEPFLFIMDSSAERHIVIPPEDAENEGIRFNFHGKGNDAGIPVNFPELSFEIFPLVFEEYLKAFNKVSYHIHRGDTYLLNLTFPTHIRTNYSLQQLFHASRAPYKLLFHDDFVVFSPEIFIRIDNARISGFPMKGTIDAGIPGAEKLILEDKKELYEHNTIVDLIRNDLAMVATGITVKRFRYIDRLKTNMKDLLQVSSEITGTLPENWNCLLGDILMTLLPAGSVTGAPKQKTVEIIHDAESGDRGFYTGVCGYFDGYSLDSAVMIRFVEKRPEGMFFRSGGGITFLSDPEAEYRELIDKVYVPVI